MTKEARPGGDRSSACKGFGLALLILLGAIAFVFHPSFKPGQALFANDGNLGFAVAHAGEGIDVLKGYWQELNLVGIEYPSSTPNVNFILLSSLGPVLSAKFTAALSLLAIGMCGWCFWRVVGFSSWVCILGGLAAALNSNIFSNSAWGLYNWTFARGFVFLALAAVHSAWRDRFIPKMILAGFATGMAILEGFDVGAIFSLYIAAYTAFLCLSRPGGWGLRLGRGVGHVVLVALCAAVIATHGLISLIGTQIQGVAGMKAKDQNTEERWNWCTQWSLPKIETLRLIIPGLFGYRMEAENGSNYWGAVGQAPGWFEHHRGYPRHSGEGEYAGVLVVLVAFWGVANLWRKKGSPYSDEERRAIGFWAGAALVSLLLAFGRHAPFYRLFYSLPFFSTMRNPIKFLSPLNISLLILFGYGLMGMGRAYLERPSAQTRSLLAQLKSWWSGVAGFDGRWIWGCVGFLGVSVLGWMVFGSARNNVLKYLEAGAFDSGTAAAIFRFANREIGLYVGFLALAISVIFFLMSGAMAGRRLKWAAVLVGLFICADLIRANTPWIIYYDYKEKYASNPIIDTLRESPHQYRVVAPALPVPQQLSYFPHTCFAWLEHQFQFYQIQSLDINQIPRMPADYEAYFGALSSAPARLWQLTNTRYLLAVADYLESLNAQLDPALRRFRILTAFALANRPSGYPGVQTNSTGPFALMEFTGALPRTMLFTRWQNFTNDAALLSQLTNASFDPVQRVLVAGSSPAATTNAAPSANPGTVEIVRYASKEVQCAAKIEVPSIFLLNDRYHPHWKVWVDGQPEPLLRCNYIMRGVFLPPGNHEIRFRFEPPSGGLFVTLSAMLAGLVLCGWVAVRIGRRPNEPTGDPVAADRPR